jgi:hypothetical protein
MTEKNKEKTEAPSRSVENATLQTADADQARHADADTVRSIQESNPDKHSGSAGGDVHKKSIEVVGLDYVVTKDTKINEKQILAFEKGAQSISREELKEKASTGDGQARDLLSYFSHAEALPLGPDRDKAVAEQQRNADRIYGRGDYASRNVTADQSQQQSTSDTGTELKTRALENPAIAPVAELRAYADKLPDGVEKDQMMRLARKQAAEFVPEIASRYYDEERQEELSVKAELLPKSEHRENDQSTAVRQNDEFSNTPEGWLNVGHRISQLSLKDQITVIGAGLTTGLEKIAEDEKQRFFGSLIGSVQGVGHVAENLAKVADFGAALILNDKAKAGRLADEFGTSVGQTIVSGVQLFQMTERYLGEVGESGDYSKPFKDMLAVGIVLNEEWSKKTPFEQERIKSELIAELLTDGLIGSHGAGAIKKCSKFTEILNVIGKYSDECGEITNVLQKGGKIAHLTDSILGHAEKINEKLGPQLDRAVGAIQKAINELIPLGDTGTGFKMPIPRDGVRISDKIAEKLEDYSMKMSPFYKEGSKKPISIKKAAEIAGVSKKDVLHLTERELAEVGLEYVPEQYREMFFEANKNLGRIRDQVQVHHKIPQTVLDKAVCDIGTFKAKEINSLKNLVAIPENAYTYSPATGEIVRVHSAITTEWGWFLAENEGNLTRRKIQAFARDIDRRYGHFYKR